MSLRTRTVRPSFFKNEELATLSPFTRLLFIGLWCLGDREGIVEDRPIRIHAELFPYSPDRDVDNALWELHAGKFIVRYEADGRNFIHIVNFVKHQKPKADEPSRGFPRGTARKISLSFSSSFSSSFQKLSTGRPALLPEQYTNAREASQPASQQLANKTADQNRKPVDLTSRTPVVLEPPSPNGSPDSRKTVEPGSRNPVAVPSPNGAHVSVQPQPPAISIWPATAQAIRSTITAWTGDQKIAQIIAKAQEALPAITDNLLAEAVIAVRKPEQKSAGLFLHTIPEWLAHHRVNGQAKQPEPTEACTLCGYWNCVCPDKPRSLAAKAG